MSDKLVVAVIRGSLPSYYPDKHHVWEFAEKALDACCVESGVRLHLTSGVPQNATETQKALDECERVNADFVLLLHGGFTMGDVARTVAASRFRAGFWSVPEPVRTGDVQLNNFVSLNMSMSIARQVRDLRTRPVQWYHGAPESNTLRRRLQTTFSALAAIKSLQGARIAVIGGLAPTFYNMEVSTSALRARLGVEVINHEMHELTARMAALPEGRVQTEVAAMLEAAPRDQVSDEQMVLSSRAALAMLQLARDNNYAALAVSDWPALQADPGMHPGAAFSWLEEHYRLPVASEGDVLGAVSQLLVLALSGKVGYLLDMTEPDLDAGQLLVWHGGGGPLYLADDAGSTWVNHPMIGRGTQQGPVYGAISDQVFKPGPVTLLRVSRDAAAMFQMTADVVAREDSGFTGCRGWLQDFRIAHEPASLEDVVSTVMWHGLEHHFILMPGDSSDVLSEMTAWMGMTPLPCRRMRSYLDRQDVD